MSDADDPIQQSFATDTLIHRMDMRIAEVTPQRAVGTIPVHGNTQPYGMLHGGATAALAETVGSLAAMAHAGDDQIAVGVDLNITHHRAVRDGLVHATASAVHLGRTTATYTISVTDDQQRIIASARLTCAIRAKSGRR